MGNATQQLGANWRGIQHSLLPGRLGFYGTEMLLSDWLRGPTGSALSGRRRSTLWSHKGLHWSLEIANKKDGLCVCVCEQEFTERFHQFLPHGFDSLFFVFVMNPSWRTFFGKRKYIYTHVTPKHYLLHWSSMIPINIQLQKRQCSGHRDGTHGQKKKNTYQSYRVRKCFKTFSLFGLLKTCSFFYLPFSFIWMLVVDTMVKKHCGVCPFFFFRCTAYWIQLYSQPSGGEERPLVINPRGAELAHVTVPPAAPPRTAAKTFLTMSGLLSDVPDSY